ncbi:MAG: ribosome maturation factor RimM [Candidatus Sumerlaeota bacterium]|nr:ribosome maturation factor RimM [Candidatus Sumerlaeota bacterium]
MRRHPAPPDQTPNSDGAAQAPGAGLYPEAERLALLGRIARPHALSGELRVIPESYNAEVWEAALDLPLYLKSPSSNELRPVRLESFHPHGSLLLAQFDGITDRTQAEALTGMELWIERDALPELEEDAYYHYDLISLTVADEASGEELGVVESISENAAQDQLVVRRPDGRNFLIPFIGVFIGTVDFKTGRIHVHLPPGLIEVNDKNNADE